MDHTFSTTVSAIYDAINVVGGTAESKTFHKMTTQSLNDAFNHYKPIGATHDGVKWLKEHNMKDSPGAL